jgi:CubicO group peptidase (beta-lactamase class C family)
VVSRVPSRHVRSCSLGSIAKPLTAVAIMHLAERGMLEMDDAITRFFDDVPDDKRGITVHHLLTHSSGLAGDLGGDYEVNPQGRTRAAGSA